MRRIGEIGNAYGELYVKRSGDAYYWQISDDAIRGGLADDDWEQIPQFLYDALIKYQMTDAPLRLNREGAI